MYDSKVYLEPSEAKVEAESLEGSNHSESALVACSWMSFSDTYHEWVLHLNNRQG